MLFVLPGRGRDGAPLPLGWRAVTVENTPCAGAFCPAFPLASLLLCLRALPGSESTTKGDGKRTWPQRCHTTHPILNPLISRDGTLSHQRSWGNAGDPLEALSTEREKISSCRVIQQVYTGDLDLRDTRLGGTEKRGQKVWFQVESSPSNNTLDHKQKAWFDVLIWSRPGREYGLVL